MFIVNPYIYGGGFPNDKSLLFDGVDEDVTTTNISALQNVTLFSVSAWVKIGTDGDFELFRRYLSASDAIIPIFYDASASRLKIFIYKGSAYQASTISTWTPALNTWYHIVMTYDGTQSGVNNKYKIYVDGVSLSLQGQAHASTPNTSGTYELTRFRTDGNADEVALFDYTLTPTQVTSIYNSGVPTDLDNTSGVTAPIHWWRMGDGDTFPTITDVGTTAGNNGTMVNMEAGDIVTDVPT